MRRGGCSVVQVERRASGERFPVSTLAALAWRELLGTSAANVIHVIENVTRNVIGPGHEVFCLLGSATFRWLILRGPYIDMGMVTLGHLVLARAWRLSRPGTCQCALRAGPARRPWQVSSRDTCQCARGCDRGATPFSPAAHDTPFGFLDRPTVPVALLARREVS